MRIHLCILFTGLFLSLVGNTQASTSTKPQRSFFGWMSNANPPHKSNSTTTATTTTTTTTTTDSKNLEGKNDTTAAASAIFRPFWRKKSNDNHDDSSSSVVKDDDKETSVKKGHRRGDKGEKRGESRKNDKEQTMMKKDDKNKNEPKGEEVEESTNDKKGISSDEKREQSATTNNRDNNERKEKPKKEESPKTNSSNSTDTDTDTDNAAKKNGGFPPTPGPTIPVEKKETSASIFRPFWLKKTKPVNEKEETKKEEEATGKEYDQGKGTKEEGSQKEEEASEKEEQQKPKEEEDEPATDKQDGEKKEKSNAEDEKEEKQTEKPKQEDPQAGESNTNKKDAGAKNATGIAFAPLGRPAPQQGHTIVYYGNPMGGSPQTMRQPSQPASSAGIAAMVDLALRLLIVTLATNFFNWGKGVYTPVPQQHYMLEHLNSRYEKDSVALSTAFQQPPKGFRQRRWNFVLGGRQRKLRKREARLRLRDYYSKTLIVMDIKTPSTESRGDDFGKLRDTVSFLLSGISQRQLDPESLEVVLLIETGGGSIHDYGLAASQLQRLKDAGVTVTACVDKFAASGGYMIACRAHRILAAPWSEVGSIGVITAGYNLHDALKWLRIQPLVLRAGKDKSPMSLFGQITNEQLKGVQRDLHKTHGSFIDFVKEARPGVSAEKVFTGKLFLGPEAVEVGLVDELITSEEYILKRIAEGDRVLKLHRYDKSRHFQLSPLDLLLLPHLTGVRGRVRNMWRQLIDMAPRALPLLRVAVPMAIMQFVGNGKTQLSFI